MVDASASLSDFMSLFTLFRQTRVALRRHIGYGEGLDRDDADFLATRTLAHIDDIETGLKWVLRAEDVPRDELRHLLTPADLVDWSSEPSHVPGRPVAPNMSKVVALRHAQVVFGLIPRTPKALVTFPGCSSYRDIKVPRTPLELRERVEELARVVWATASGQPLSTMDPERTRRSYGFFEAGSWVTAAHLRRITRN